MRINAINSGVLQNSASHSMCLSSEELPPQNLVEKSSVPEDLLPRAGQTHWRETCYKVAAVSVVVIGIIAAGGFLYQMHSQLCDLRSEIGELKGLLRRLDKLNSTIRELDSKMMRKADAFDIGRRIHALQQGGDGAVHSLYGLNAEINDLNFRVHELNSQIISKADAFDVKNQIDALKSKLEGDDKTCNLKAFESRMAKIEAGMNAIGSRVDVVPYPANTAQCVSQNSERNTDRADHKLLFPSLVESYDAYSRSQERLREMDDEITKDQEDLSCLRLTHTAANLQRLN